jgi:hypothetical protein
LVIEQIYLKQKLNAVLFSSAIPDPREAAGANVKPEGSITLRLSFRYQSS